MSDISQFEDLVRNIHQPALSRQFPPTTDDWSQELRAIFELILHNQHSLAQSAALSFASRYRESCILLNPQVLLCAQKLWKIAKYIDIVEALCLKKQYARAVDTLPDIVRLSYELQDFAPFKQNHHQILISYLCQNKLK